MSIKDNKITRRFLMDIFEYLPQLIVAYDGDDEFANLIHVKKADKSKDYYCPCCGGIVKPRALDSNKEQSHYYHNNGKCTKESQLHFFCKNWLFETGSKFYVENKLYEVASIEVEELHYTPFGNYKPDVTVYTTSGKVIYFEMFFTNRKTGDDYFCKWEFLKNDVVDVNIKEYMFKTDTTSIPSFTYLYHDGRCYSKPYIKRDLYANTIGRIKHELTRQKVLNYKARIEHLDWFWQALRNNTQEEILDIISEMNYEDMVSCYEIIKRKQCVLYLKNDVLNTINQKVVSTIRESLGIPYDENIYFDLDHVKGRTYRAGIKLNIKTEHIVYEKLFSYFRDYWCDFDELREFPKVVFSRNIFSPDEVNIADKDISELTKVYNNVLEQMDKILEYENKLSVYEKNTYKIRMKNDLHTVLVNNNGNFELLFENRRIYGFDINKLEQEINDVILDNKNTEFLERLLNSDDYNEFLSDIKKYGNIDIRLDINKSTTFKQSRIYFKTYISNKCIFEEELKPSMDDFIEKRTTCESVIQDFLSSYSSIISLVDKINKSKNNFWKSYLLFDYNGEPVIEVDQKYFKPRKYLTLEKIYLGCLESNSEECLINKVESGMMQVLKNMERYGYRVMEVCE